MEKNMNKFKHIHFNDPNDFITFLEPENEAWNSNKYLDKGWIFRGQAQSEWGLHSKLARTIINDKYTNNKLGVFYFQENTILNDFMYRCREIGLELPITQKRFSDISFLDFEERLHLSALGQHYGLPTRMLDWSRNRWNALLFALDSLNMSANYSPTSNLSLWCLDRKYIECGLPVIIEEKNYRLQEFHPSFHKNKNAISQSGVFTYMEGEYDKYSAAQAYKDLNTTSINHFDIDFVLNNREFDSSRRDIDIIGYKLTISRKHFNFLETWLSNRLINYYNLFPDYQGVALSSTYYWKQGLRRDALEYYKSRKRDKRPETIEAKKRATEKNNNTLKID
jgi:hypothetical protein